MSLVVSDGATTMDGYASGAGQALEQPFGDLDQAPLHGWMFDEPYAAENAPDVAAIVDAGAFIMGRTRFGPDRGDWNLGWSGWWGPNTPYHGPVFVLAHRDRSPGEMEGGTTFHFVTDRIHSALDRAHAAAGDRTDSIAGGPATLNRYLAAGLVDDLRLHVTPTIAGGGERVFEDVPAQYWEQVSVRATTIVTHLVYRPRR